MNEGSSLSPQALTDAIAGSGDVIEAFANTASALMPYFLIIAAVGASLVLVRWLVVKMTCVHSDAPRYASDSFPGMSSRMKSEWDALDDFGMPQKPVKSEDDMPLSSFDSVEYERTKHRSYDGSYV